MAISKEKIKAIMKAKFDAAGEHSLTRKIAESSLYDGKPAARFLLTQLAVMAMKDEKASYPEDAPDSFKADKTGWCWMSQFRLGLRIGLKEQHTHRLLNKFYEDGVVLKRDWIDDHGTPHSEYKVVEKVVDAFQRPSQNRGVERAPRYTVKRHANKGSFSNSNQPGKRNADGE